ncbi:MAG: nucleotidyltransferase domain-containing protein, partial [Saprospiraceae bacterium]
MSILQKLYKLQLIGRIPEYVPTNSVYEVVMGSVAYGANLDTTRKSDTDIYSIYLPLKEQLFPNLSGKVWGFDEFPETKTYQFVGLKVEDEEFDISCYPITKFFHLAEQNNPNVIDALFVDFDCVRK